MQEKQKQLVEYLMLLFAKAQKFDLLEKEIMKEQVNIDALRKIIKEE